MIHPNKTFLAIIPARGKSKRLPHKNLLDLCGKPLIAWSIEAGIKSKYIDKLVVSSDDNKILDIANKYNIGAIKRPKKLANDTATTFDVIKHTIDKLESYEYIVLLQPTSPLRNYKHIDESIKLLEQKNADAIISVCEMEHSPLWCNTLDKDRVMDNFLSEEIANKRSQDLEKYFRLNGAIYICRTDKLLKQKSFFLKQNTYAYLMNRESSVDIDYEIDLKFANFLASKSS